MDAQVWVSFVLGESGKIVVFVGDELCLDVYFQGVWFEFGFD